jgi:hypothetical protein
MNNYQKNWLNMFGSLSAVCKEHRLSYENIEPLKNGIDEFELKYTGLKEVLEGNEMLTTGYTSQKSVNKEAMAELSASMAGAARAYAFDKGDLALFDILDHSKTDISNSSDRVALGLAEDIIRELEKILPSLTGYLIVNDDLEKLKQLTKVFETSLDTKIVVKTGKVVNTKDVSILFAQVRRLLDKKLDALVVRVKDILPDFYNEYFQARQIIDLSYKGSASAEEVKVEEAIKV